MIGQDGSNSRFNGERSWQGGIEARAGGVQTPVDIERTEAVGRLRNGANWFFWVAGLSLANSVLAFSGSDWVFIFGLGITQIIDALVIVFEAGTVGKTLALVFNCSVAAIFILFGVLARKRMIWAFWMGMTLYAADGLLLLLATAFSDLLGFGFHLLALLMMYRGLHASRELEAIGR